MNILFSILQQAGGLMPHGIPARTSGRLLTTLLFFKIISDLSSRVVDHTSGDDLTMRIVMPPDCTYNTCLSATAPNTAATLCAVFQRLVSVQPFGTLNDLFFPEEFSKLGRLLRLSGNTTGLYGIVQLIGSLNFSTFSASPALVALFSAACHACHCGPRPFIAEAAPLMAQLLHPTGGERVFDPLCGQGTLLTACADLLAQQAPDAALGLYGMEGDTGDFAIAKMRCHLAGLPMARLKRTDTLAVPQHRRNQFRLAKTDMVITALPDHDRRFSAQRSVDSRVALFWYSLFCLKTNGRMVVLVPPALLESHASHALRRHLIKKNLLEAVITLPGVRRPQTPDTSAVAPLLLLIHRNKPHSTVAFITPGGTRKHQHSEIMHAYHDWLAERKHPHLRTVENAWFTDHDFALHESPLRLAELHQR